LTDTASPIIRPMNLPELLDRSIRLYRQNFLKFIGIFAIPYIPLMFLQTVVSFFYSRSLLNGISTNPSNPLTPEMLRTLSGSLVIAFVQFILVQGIATAALTRAVANNYTGKPVGILDSYRTLSTSWFRLILAMIVIFFIIIILMVWMFIPCVGWFSGPGILFFIGLAVNPLVAPVVSLEKLGVLSSLRRAWDLARSRFWWLLGCVFVLTLLGQLIVSGPVYLLNFILQAALSALTISFDLKLAITTLLPAITSMFMSLLYVPLQLTVMTVVYFDLRARSEGLDLAIQMTGAETDSDNGQVNLPEISNQSSIPLLTGLDIGRFAILSLGAVAFYFLIVIVLILISMAAIS